MSEILDVTVHMNTSVRQLSITVINQDNQIRGSKDVFRFTLSEISVLCGPVRIGKGERKEETKKTQAPSMAHPQWSDFLLPDSSYAYCFKCFLLKIKDFGKEKHGSMVKSSFSCFYVCVSCVQCSRRLEEALDPLELCGC